MRGLRASFGTQLILLHEAFRATAAAAADCRQRTAYLPSIIIIIIIRMYISWTRSPNTVHTFSIQIECNSLYNHLLRHSV